MLDWPTTLARAGESIFWQWSRFRPVLGRLRVQPILESRLWKKSPHHFGRRRILNGLLAKVFRNPD
jgi:hypothetical protein